MFSNHTVLNKYLALFTFFVSLIVYMLTLAPTASFWDSGEFIAVAHGLQVNHPPGAPFYSLVGRLFSMFMPVPMVSVSINFLSALTSALSVMLLYLIIIRLVREFKSNLEDMSAMDKIGMYGGALVGSLTFAVTDTFWFSAVESEVYAMSMFFTAIVVWLALKWSEMHEEPYSEKWLVLIAYMFGLAIGVHLLNLLAIFFVALIIYYKKRDFSLLSFSVMGGLAVITFFSIYPFTIQVLPDWAGKIGEATYGLIGPITFVFLVVGSLVGGIYYTHIKKMRMANIILISYAMIMIGYSSYSVIFIRSLADPPIDENDPETIEDFVKYLKREQYGSTPLLKGYNFDAASNQINRNEEKLFPRRYSPDPNHLQFYAQYNSDWDYFWSYQVNHMYLRYLYWNFVGRSADIQDASWQSGFSAPEYPDNMASNSYYFIPFLLGIFGLIFHFTSDWRRAFSLFVLFIVTGFAIIIFLNQTPFQPRERDYAYGGSFFVFAAWVGLGVTGLVDLLKSYIKENNLAAYGIVGLCLIGSPLLMAVQNWDDHDRSKRQVAPDYAKNLLNSVAPNALIFTNGDNDTFPLWYAQEVEGVRTDVRIVCLSLLNTDWYIKQMRDQWSHESAPLPIILSDKEIEEMTSGLSRWNPQMVNIPVDKELLKNAFSEDQAYKEAIGQPMAEIPILKTGTDFEIPVDELDNQMIWRLNGRYFGKDQAGNDIYYLQTQDRVIINLLQNNDWLRPIYFANTVSQGSQLDLSPYLRVEGKAYRIVPKLFNTDGSPHIDTDIHTRRFREFSFTKWNHPDVYFDENIRRMLGNYRYNFLQLAEAFIDQNEPDSALTWLKFAEDKIPFRADETEHTIKILFANRYAQLESADDAIRLADDAIEASIINLDKAVRDVMLAQSRINDLNTKFEEHRRNGNIEKQRQVRQQISNIFSSSESKTREVQRYRQTLALAQYVYFESEAEDKALELEQRVSDLLEGTQIPGLGKSRQENLNEVSRYGIL